ncbi:TetR/AcrR family transcriptional regulator [Promicromonospora sp. NPDC050249]|uniref:TetR/AcrR family transcriptional regulator n=1 Tax=Promicromonospora sp. NPDC050249 TaxID=3154743 RepID=UPI0033ED3423
MARPRSFDNDQVLAAVERQFRHDGYAGTSLDDIAAVTRLGRGSLYAAFGDKHELFLRALGRYCERKAAEAESKLTGPGENAIARMWEYLQGNLRFVFDDPDRLGCMAGRFAVEADRSDARAAELIAECFARQRAALRDCLMAAQQYGALEAEADGDELAAMLLTVVRGIDVMAGSGIDERLAEAAFRHAFTALPLAHRGKQELERL